MVRYSLKLILKMVEVRPQMKTYINLDDNQLGPSVDWDNSMVGFFIYKKKKKFPIMESPMKSMTLEKAELEQLMFDLVQRYYNSQGRGSLSKYTKLELSLLTFQIWFHISAGTLPRLVEKEVIYY